MIRVLCAALLLSACSGSDEGRPPPPDSFFYPTGIVIDPQGNWAYVTNGNTDLRFNGGSIVALDLQAALHQFKATPSECTQRDPIDNRIPVCDEKKIIDASKTVLVGNFPGQPAVQRFLKATGAGIKRGTMAACDPTARPRDLNCIPQLAPDPSKGFRMLLPVRGDPSLTWINVAANGVMDCKQPAGPVGRCDRSHRITTLVPNPSVVYAPEPFGVAVSDELGVAITSHLASATVSLIDIGDDPAFTPQFVDVLNSIFDLNAQGGRAAFGIALRRIDPTLIPDTCAGLPACTMGDYEIFFATSRISARLAQILARGADLCRPGLGTSEDPDPCTAGIVPRTMALVESTQVRLDIYLADGSDTRDIKFSRDGTRAYVVDRQPPSVLVMDTSPIPPPAGDPRDVILRAIEVCPQPSLLALREDAGPLRVYVTCFAAGEIFVVDPLRAEVVDVIEVGRGPNAVQIFRDPTPDGNHELLGIVANFADNDIAVISLEPGKATENTVLFKIGMPNPVAQH